MEKANAARAKAKERTQATQAVMNTLDKDVAIRFVRPEQTRKVPILALPSLGNALSENSKAGSEILRGQLWEHIAVGAVPHQSRGSTHHC
jgi:hypothetical protein